MLLQLYNYMVSKGVGLALVTRRSVPSTRVIYRQRKWSQRLEAKFMPAINR